MNRPTNALDSRRIEAEALQARFALRVASRLDAAALDVGHEVGERLRVSRERALERAGAARSTEVAAAGGLRVNAPQFAPAGAGGGDQTPWWLRAAALLLPLIALVGGLLWIQESNMRAQISAAADVDAALLTDNVPPHAYNDPGFVEFLKTSGE